MSSSIYINISNLESGWNPIVGKAQKCTEYIDNSKKYIEIVRDNLDYRIKNKNGIGGRVESISKSVNKISEQIENIETFLNNSISKYTTAEQRVNQLAIDYGILEPEKNLSDKWNEWLGSWWTEEGKFDWDRLWDVGKAVVTTIGQTCGAVLLGTAAAGASGPLAIAALVVGAVVLGNEAVTAGIDLISAITGINDLEGFNFLETVCTLVGGDIGKGVYGFVSAAANTAAAALGLGISGFNLKEIWDGGKLMIQSLKSWSTFSQNIIEPFLLQGGIIEYTIKTGLKGSHAEKALMFVASMGGTCLDFLKKVFNPIEFILPADNISGNVGISQTIFEEVTGIEVPDGVDDLIEWLAGGIDGFLGLS